jgi:D-glycero-D-manno-heptose 1,7-bisphosphate phosphatase
MLFPDAIATMKQFKSKSFTIIGASNQGGVGKGHKSLENCIAEQAYTLELAYEADVAINEILFCPDYEGKTCLGVDGWMEENFISSSRDYSEQYKDCSSFRKPSGGMIELARFLYEDPFDKNEIIFVGDRTEDEQAARAANVQFISADKWREQFWIA